VVVWKCLVTTNTPQVRVGDRRLVGRAPGYSPRSKGNRELAPASESRLEKDVRTKKRSIKSENRWVGKITLL